MKKRLFLFAAFFAFFFAGKITAQSINYNGTTSWTQITNNANMQATNAMTIEAWINATAWKPLIYQGSVVSNANNTGTNNGFDLRAANNGQAEFNISIGGTWQHATSQQIMVIGQWYHLAGVFDGSSLKIYINGFIKDSVPVSGTITNFAGNLRFGACPGWTGRLFNGKIDEVRLWNVARSTQQIRNNICTSLVGNETGLKGYWKCNENAGTTTADASPNGNNGTLTACTWSTQYSCALPTPDVGVVSIVSPVSGIGLTASETVTATIVNYSNTPVTNVPVSYKINGGAAVNETISATVPGLSGYTYSFTAHANLSAAGNYTFKVYTGYAGDVDHTNDTATKQIINAVAGAPLSLQFNGNDTVVVPNAAALNPTGAFTLEAWFKSTDFSGNIFQKTSNSPDKGYSLGLSSQMGKGLIVFTISDASWNAVISLPDLIKNRWYHVAGVYDGSSIKIYKNGKLAGQKYARTIIPSTMNLWIGKSFNGNLDEIRIWNTARTQAEIESNLNAQLTGSETGLVAYYRVDDGLYHSTLADSTGNGHNGSLGGFPDFVTPWQSPYTLNQNDVAVTSVFAPASSNTFSDSARLKINVYNNGFNNISNIPVYYSVNNGPYISDTITDAIPPFTTFTYFAPKPYNISALTSCPIKAYTQMSGDAYVYNDTASNVITKSTTFTPFDHVHFDFASNGQEHFTYMTFPENMDAISQIMLHVHIDCPGTGCDPWDQAVQIKAYTEDGSEYELARLITPFGIACGPWNIDITDFKSVLKGKVLLKAYIQVWGSSGWLMTVAFEFVPGTPAYKFQRLDPLWNTDYLTYGDPGISYVIQPVTVNVPVNMQKSTIRLTTTGHGQGNTSNAAEFYYPTHNIKVDGTPRFNQTLSTTCSSNPCSPQNGTWSTTRAGWCPGHDVIPNTYDLTPYATAGTPVALSYVLQTYTNSLNTGYNGGSHTEPFYRIHAYLISQSDTNLDPIYNAASIAIIAPIQGQAPSSNADVIIRYKNKGTTSISNFKVGYWINSGVPVTETVTQTVNPGATIDYTFAKKADLSAIASYMIAGVVSLTNDIYPDDDYTESTYINVEVPKIRYDKYVKVYPNPTDGKINFVYAGNSKNVSVSLTDLRCIALFKADFGNGSSGIKQEFDFSNYAKGVYFLKINTDDGTDTRKIVIN